MYAGYADHLHDSYTYTYARARILLLPRACVSVHERARRSGSTAHAPLRTCTCSCHDVSTYVRTVMHVVLYVQYRNYANNDSH